MGGGGVGRGGVARVIHTDTGCSGRSTRLSVILGSHRKLHEAFVSACGKSVWNTFQLPPDLLLMQQNCQLSPFSFGLFLGFSQIKPVVESTFTAASGLVLFPVVIYVSSLCLFWTLFTPM